MFRRATLVLAVLGLLAAVPATGGFSTVTADRDLSVAVVADDRAYLGVDVAENTTGDVTVTVVNRFPVTLGTVTTTANGTTRTVENLAPGESATLEFEDCERVAIEGTGEDTRVELTRDCP